MNDQQLSEILDKQDAMRELINGKRGELTGWIQADQEFQGLMATVLTDVITSGQDERESLLSTFLVAISIGQLLNDPAGELDDLLEDYPTSEELADAFTILLERNMPKEGK